MSFILHTVILLLILHSFPAPLCWTVHFLVLNHLCSWFRATQKQFSWQKDEQRPRHPVFFLSVDTEASLTQFQLFATSGEKGRGKKFTCSVQPNETKIHHFQLINLIGPEPSLSISIRLCQLFWCWFRMWLIDNQDSKHSELLQEKQWKEEEVFWHQQFSAPLSYFISHIVSAEKKKVV